jgi:hypothetical protein
MQVSHRLVLVLAASVGALQACNKGSASQGQAPPPAESASKPGACAGGGPAISDPASAAVFPRELGGYCVDPNGETRVFGLGGKLSIDAICMQAWDGGCEQYKELGVKRVVQLRYIDGAGSPGSVEIYLSQFPSDESAYSIFTSRVVGDGDPMVVAPRPLEAGAAAAIGTGGAYVWKGVYLAEMSYANEQETPEQMRASSDRVMMPIAKEIGAKLPGPPSLPLAAARLPKSNLVPLGISYASKDVLNLEGVGPGAVGFYKEGKRRYRMVSIVRADADQAKDVLRAFSRIRGAIEQKNVGDGAYRFARSGSDAKIDWIVARSGTSVFGIGDEEFVAHAGLSTAEREQVCLSKDDKLAKLSALLK